MPNCITYIIFIFVFLSFSFVNGQSVNNVKAFKSGNYNIQINYNITGDEKISHIEVYYSLKDAGLNNWSSWKKIKQIQGDTVNIEPGSNFLVWDVLAENGTNLIGNVRFKIDCDGDARRKEIYTINNKIKIAKTLKFGSLAASASLIGMGIYYTRDAKAAYAAYQTATTNADALREQAISSGRKKWWGFGLSVVPIIFCKLFHDWDMNLQDDRHRLLKNNNYSSNISISPMQNGGLFTYTLKF